MTKKPHELIEKALYRPVPNMDALRARKLGYRDTSIDIDHPLFNEPLVKIAEYGLAGQAHYSRLNTGTGDPVEGVPKELWLRKSLAETLAQLNTTLNQPAVAAFFGGEVELYIDDAFRPVWLQKLLYHEVFPALIRKNNPNISDEQMAERRKDLIAMPSYDPRRPSPHATGGAVDIKLRFKQSERSFVPNVDVPVGHQGGDTSEHVNPDYFEYHQPTSDQVRLAQRNRRAFYAIMAGTAFGVSTDLVNNPTEWWHWSRGDQLWAQVKRAKTAYYSFAQMP